MNRVLFSNFDDNTHDRQDQKDLRQHIMLRDLLTQKCAHKKRLLILVPQSM
jgi:hypothetical protein